MNIASPLARPAKAGRFLFVARYFTIEPLGILYLAGLLRDMGWECEAVLVKDDTDEDNYDFEPLYQAVREWKPDFVGFQIWTGWHLQCFAAADAVRAMGTKVIIGGPHATYFYDDCIGHADWVIKASGFGLLRDVLEGKLPPGIHFDKEGRQEILPHPDRSAVYNSYPELGASPIKSMFASVGCPFTCTYCYAPTFNAMHGGFKFINREVDDLIKEALAIQERWPLKLVYFQDDIFGYKLDWVEEFAKRWKSEVGVPFHAQIRLELTRHDIGNKRLDLFTEAGCNGITLAIESGSQFMRDRVLFRHMPEELILEGCERIMSRGMSLRTEQILAVPFSNMDTDLSTLDLNNRINPTMAWCSLLAPYGGTDIGTICNNFGFHSVNNDDLKGRSYERSTLRHPAGGPREIEPVVEKLGVSPNAPPVEQPLLNMKAVRRNGGNIADVFYQRKERKGKQVELVGSPEKVGTIEYLSDKENERYCDESLRVQRLFNFLAKVPDAQGLGRDIAAIGHDAWNWEELGTTVTEHLRRQVGDDELERQRHLLAREMQLESPEQFPELVAQNPHYFTYFLAGGTLAKKVVEKKIFEPGYAMSDALDSMSTVTRHHLFHFGLYKVEKCEEPIAVR